MKNTCKKKILIFAPGTIGDTLLAIPALSHLCRNLHKNGNEIHLYNSYPVTASSAHSQLFQHLDFFDSMRFVPVDSKIRKNPFLRNSYLRNNVPAYISESFSKLISLKTNRMEYKK